MNTHAGTVLFLAHFKRMIKKLYYILFAVFLFFGFYLVKCHLGVDILKHSHLAQLSSVKSLQNKANRGWGVLVKKALADEQLGPVIKTDVSAQENVITVDCENSLGLIKRDLFGVNLLGYAGAQASNYGCGIWNGKWNEPFDEAVQLLKSAGFKSLRFPGGCGVNHYDWRQVIGKDRKGFLFGIDEFLKVCESVGAEPIITISYFTGGPADAADLVRYTYGRVKYFEIGNEVYDGNNKDIKKVSAGEYAKRYLQYYDAMKAANPDIQIGVVLHYPEWNTQVTEIIQNKVDFGIVHWYPRLVKGKVLESMSGSEIFNVSLAIPVLEQNAKLHDVAELLRLHAGHDVPLAVTEFNGGFAQEKSVPYRFTLGNALVNAELIHVFMAPDNNVLFVNYWNFINEYWGMIANGFNGNPKDLRNPYYLRPNYYVFDMYANHFGDVLLGVDIKCDSYDASGYKPNKAWITKIKTGTPIKNNLLDRNWAIKPAQGVNAVEKDGVLEVEFLDCNDTVEGRKCLYNYYHSVKKVNIEPGAYYKLIGYIKTDGLTAEPGVCLEIQDARGWTKTRSSASTQRVQGSTDWQYVETIYKTLPDAKAVKVIARRAGKKGPLKGKVEFKEVKLEKFIPFVSDEIPYLSVNASKSSDGNKVYLMVVNKNLEENITADISIPGFEPAEAADAWVLNGPSVDAVNEENHNNVKVVHKKFNVLTEIASPSARNDTGQENYSFKFTFEPHSLTAIEIQRKI